MISAAIRLGPESHAEPAAKSPSAGTRPPSSISRPGSGDVKRAGPTMNPDVSDPIPPADTVNV